MVFSPDIDLDLLRTFLTVVESGGFTLASKRLHVTQSGITLKIKRLEQQLNCRLFQRTTKPLELSHEGEVVLGYARRLLDLSQEMAERVAKPRKEIPLRLGVVDHFGPELLPVWISRFKETFPNAKIISDIGLTHDLLKDLEDDKFDLVIASAGYTAMGEYRLAAAIQETHFQKETLLWVKAKNSKIDPKQDPLPLVMFGSKCRWIMIWRKPRKTPAKSKCSACCSRHSGAGHAISDFLVRSDAGLFPSVRRHPRKLLLDRRDHPGVGRLDLGGEARRDHAVAADQILVEVPARPVERALGRGPPVERMGAGAIDHRLGGDREARAILVFGGFGDFGGELGSSAVPSACGWSKRCDWVWTNPKAMAEPPRQRAFRCQNNYVPDRHVSQKISQVYGCLVPQPEPQPAPPLDRVTTAQHEKDRSPLRSSFL